jgi:hypothetical protein
MKKGIAILMVLVSFVTMTNTICVYGAEFNLSKVKWKGDFRLRNQTDWKTNKEDRNRTRIRARFGFETYINELLKLGMHFTTGGDDPISTNQTLQDSFSTKEIQLDQAYIKYQPKQELIFTGGKFKNPYYSTTLVWDKDVRLEGINITAKRLFKLGIFIIDEVKESGADPYLVGIQAGALSNQKLKLALSYYLYTHIKGYKLDHSPDTNTKVDEKHSCDFRLFNITSKILIDKFNIPLIIIGDYVYNTDANDTGWLLGVWIGEKKIKKPQQWQISYNYRVIEKDAVLDVFCDSDFHDGGTNAKGHKLEFKFGLLKNTILNLTYFNTDIIDGNENDVDTFMVDVNVKW